MFQRIMLCMSHVNSFAAEQSKIYFRNLLFKEGLAMSKTNSPDLRDYTYIIPETIFLDQDLDYHELRVYGLMRSFMDSYDVFAEDFVSYLSEKLHMEVTIIKNAISKLGQKGYLDIMSR